MKWSAVIGDFGSTKYLKELENEQYNPLTLFGTTITKYYYTELDCLYSRSALEEGRFEEWRKLQQLRDLYGLAASIWFFCSGHRPHRIRHAKEFPIISEEKLLKHFPSVKEVLGDDGAKILVKTLTCDPKQRQSAEKILCVCKTPL